MAATESKPAKRKRGNPKGKGPSPAARKKAGRSTSRAKALTGRAKKVTPALYAEMFEAYMEKPSARHVARECGVTWETARRVIDQGYPKSAMPPLRDRYRVAMAEAHKKADYALADANAQSLIILRGYKTKLAERVAKLKADDLPAVLGSELDRMVRLESFLLGGADARTDLVVGGSGVYEGMTYEERLGFLRTGLLPVEGLGPMTPSLDTGEGDDDDAQGPGNGRDVSGALGRDNGSGRGRPS